MYSPLYKHCSSYVDVDSSNPTSCVCNMYPLYLLFCYVHCTKNPVSKSEHHLVILLIRIQCIAVMPHKKKYTIHLPSYQVACLLKKIKLLFRSELRTSQCLILKFQTSSMHAVYNIVDLIVC